jgi:hypothetical protein
MSDIQHNIDDKTEDDNSALPGGRGTYRFSLLQIYK